MSNLSFDTKKLAQICKKNDVSKMYVFGSAARGEATKSSDVDLLVEFSKQKSLLKVVSLERELEEGLGTKVDLLTEAAISPYLRDYIKKDLRLIYEER